jgi:hypothetical protein
MAKLPIAEISAASLIDGPRTKHKTVRYGLESAPSSFRESKFSMEGLSPAQE